MGEVVDLRRPIPIEDDEFIENLARFADGTLTEAAVKAKYRLTEEEWAALGTDDTLVRKIEDVKIHRIRSGRTKRERAQNEIIDAPPILAGIMRNPTANERHKIDSIKALDALATGGAPEAAAAGARFEIRINIGDDSLYFNKSIAINAGDTDPNDEVDTDVTSTPWGLVAAIAKKQGDDGNGNAI